ncbi:MAG: phytanoyl-CoA hydroxylase [Candidatus Poriferisodalaceae bacterium]|jgi:phytanoyl-CoA hydroxylase|tara:strand:- start:1538 stop:2443 length:906 start_codon:yes stop_codon:yes gene_type:complete
MGSDAKNKQQNLNDSPSLARDQSLSEVQVRQFHEDGFLVIDNLFDSAEIDMLRDACSEPEDTEWETAKKTIHALGLTTRASAFLDLARDSRIVALLRALIGDDIQLQHSKLAAQPAAAEMGGFAWHQDFAFYPHTNTDLVAAMVMLDDATADNGCMRMIRGSHKRGLLNHMDKDGVFTGMCQEPKAWKDHLGDVVDITPRAGGISLHHCLMLHGSGPNQSGEPRRGLVYQYRADDAFQLADRVWDDTGLLVSGKRREQVRCEEGTVRLPKSVRYPGHPFGNVWNQEGEFAQKLNEEESGER